jgi:transposase InsO family protein
VSIYPFIEAEKAGRRSVKRACELLKVSRAAFYARLQGPSQRAQDDAALAAEIQAVHAGSKGRYGAPRVHAELRRGGRRHGRKRVARLMRQAGIAGRAAKRWKKTTIADPAAAARADRIRRDFTADASGLNARWCGDITYIATWEGWLFLAILWNLNYHGCLLLPCLTSAMGSRVTVGWPPICRGVAPAGVGVSVSLARRALRAAWPSSTAARSSSVSGMEASMRCRLPRASSSWAWLEPLGV